MSKALEEILLGTWSPPEGEETVRKHLVMKARPRNDIQQSIRDSDALADAEVAILRFLRAYRHEWFSASDIYKKTETKFSVGGLGTVLKGMVQEDFLHVQRKGRFTKVTTYRFKGVDE